MEGNVLLSFFALKWNDFKTKKNKMFMLLSSHEIKSDYCIDISVGLVTEENLYIYKQYILLTTL